VIRCLFIVGAALIALAGAGYQKPAVAAAQGFAEVDTAAVETVALDTTSQVIAAPDSSATELSAWLAADTVWALQLQRIATLDSAGALHEYLLRQDIQNFVRIRADSAGYWYEVLVEPSPDRQSVLEAQTWLQGQGLNRDADLLSGSPEELTLGLVLAGPGMEDETAEGAAARSGTAASPEAGSAAAGASGAGASSAVAATAGASKAGPGGTGPLDSASPELEHYQAPEYPARLREAGISGTVLVRVVSDGQGAVVDAEVVQSVHPELDAQALAAAYKCRFAPKIVDGAAVGAAYTLPFVFE
jgi:TonB family protein